MTSRDDFAAQKIKKRQKVGETKKNQQKTKQTGWWFNVFLFPVFALLSFLSFCFLFGPASGFRWNMESGTLESPKLDGFSLVLPLPYRVAVILVAGMLN